MLYSPLIKKAMHIMFQSHKDDQDKGGYPYAFHPFYLATQMADEDSTCVALLHDVLEDHGDIWTFEKLADEGFNEIIIEALRLLTHKEGVPYLDYVQEVGTNPLARKVKIADLKHNLDESRTDGQPAKKHDLYVEALELLQNRERESTTTSSLPTALTPADKSAIITGDSRFINQKGAKYYVSGDYRDAVEYYHIAAAMGNTDAISNLGYCYLYGRDIEQNTALALAYFHIAARRNNIDALYKLGDIYSRDRWGMKDPELSLYYYLRASHQLIQGNWEQDTDLIEWCDDLESYPSLCFALGWELSPGGQLRTNLEQAFLFLEKAEAGYRQQIANGAEMYKESYQKVLELLEDPEFDEFRETSREEPLD